MVGMSRAYLDPLHDELDRLRRANETLAAGNRVACARFERAEARVVELRAELAAERAFHALRSAALNRTGTSNDHLRATVAACPRCANSLEPTT